MEILGIIYLKRKFFKWLLVDSKQQNQIHILRKPKKLFSYDQNDGQHKFVFFWIPNIFSVFELIWIRSDSADGKAAGSRLGGPGFESQLGAPVRI